MRIGYLLVIAIATLSNLGVEPIGSDELRRRVADAMSPNVAARDVVDGLRNLLLFAGWGLAWCITARDGRFRHAIVIATITGLFISAAVESAQLFSSLRQASVLDVLTNTGGAFMGGAGAVAMLHGARAAHGSRSFVGLPMLVFAAAYGGAAMLEIVLPGVRQELLAGASGGAVARLRLAVSQVGWGSSGVAEFLLQVLLMIPAGVFAVAALAESGRSYLRALWLTACGGALLAALLELARGTTGQPIETGMIVAHAAGFVGGGWLAAHWLPTLTQRYRGRARPRMLVAAYIPVLLLWAWRPFVPISSMAELIASFTPGHLMPLAALAMKMDLFSAADVAISFLLYFPVGALSAVWPLRLHGRLAGVLPGIWIALAIEAGQIFVAGRFFDATDVIIGVSGLLAGWALMRRAGFRPYGEML
ncbi:MAG TPA: VanZ family protein [Longimicrobiales bacterium]|nr:VanZ family protein [Longimicrobiales bacterium]